MGGGNAEPSEQVQKRPAPPPASLGAEPSKTFFSFAEEKIRRAQIRKSEENFFAGWRALASGGGAER
ncbi:MAG: hypothetical protein A3H02_00115 [Candidatus Niyogibacteria bacterium RIFCSPLOWO2_12_FULL_41_13]|uniref:Uncharacterized protein n=1 Tax=Candidatus Niyogibacteria bacterium RIFCSPLOWO2_12_FULL_41_13 TaxID=1801726 RepID=A0A1G2F3A6_9BACT|nr:MAG: hypothetical protein A3H02_00115 [Candidatus Niyogibacteria bacterium RIFCSPLOWO2_12_FULL_41_13]